MHASGVKVCTLNRMTPVACVLCVGLYDYSFGCALVMIYSVRMRSSRVGWLVALGALGCAMTVPALPAQAYTVKIEPWDECYFASRATMATLEVHLSPANGATVPAGTSVTFSGNSGVPVMFAVASSPALLSSPDIDSGVGSLQPGTSSYAFTSTKATAIPGTIYWDASF